MENFSTVQEEERGRETQREIEREQEERETRRDGERERRESMSSRWRVGEWERESIFLAR